MYKTCKRCKKSFPEDDFYKHPTTADYRQPWCIACDRHLRRDRHTFNTYGLTRDDLEDWLDRIDYRCEICSVDFETERFGYDIDHNHETGVVRGLICRSCNLGLGKFKDDPDLLRKALEFLQRT